MRQKNKKIFYLNKHEEKPVGAGGVILYRFINGINMELLLVESRGNYEDFGGCVDDEDDTIIDTVAREAYEESNKLLKIKSIKKRLNDAQFAYSERSKYVVYVICANEREEQLNSDDFGDIEIHDNISRKVKWIPLDVFLAKEVIQYKLNWRLKNKTLFDILKNIKNDKKNSINLFISNLK